MFVVRRLVPVRADRGGARLEPRPGRARRAGDRVTDGPRRQHTRVHDFLPVTRDVPAVDAASGEIDQRVASLDLALPGTGRRAIPRDHAPRLRLGTPAQDHDLIAAGVKGAGENRPDLS